MDSGYDNVFPALPDVPKFDPNDLNKSGEKHVNFAVVNHDSKSSASESDTDVPTNIMLSGKGVTSAPFEHYPTPPPSITSGELPGYVLYVKNDGSTLQMFHTYDTLSDYLVNATSNKVQADFETNLCMSEVLNASIKDLAHHSSLGEYLRHLYTNDKLMDVKIEIGNVVMMAHRVVLCCFSEYLADLFYKSHRSRIPFNLKINGVSAESFAVFLEFVYTGELVITPTTATDLLLIADYLQVKALQKRRHLIFENLPLEQIVRVLAQQPQSLPRNVYEKFVGHVIQLFSEAVLTKYFVQLGVEVLCRILSSDELVVSTEFQVYKVANDWLFYDLNQRVRYAERVLHLIRYCYMTQDELFRCIEMTALVRDHEQYHTMFTKANWILTANILGRHEPFKYTVPPPRKCYKLGFSRKATSIPLPVQTTHLPETPQPARPGTESFQFPPPMMTSTPVPSPPSPMTSFPSPKLTNKPVGKPVMLPSTMQRMSSPIPKSVDILVVGGFPTEHDSVLDPQDSGKDQWVRYCHLPEPMQRHAVTVMSGKLYLIGGFNPTHQGEEPVPTRQMFTMNIGDKQWQRRADMIEARYNHCACALRGKVYAIGGQGHDNSILSSVECYIPQADMWAYVHYLNVPRYAASVACLGGKIYVVGGMGENTDNFTQSQVLSDVEVFDPSQNDWKSMANLRFPRCNASLVNVNNRLYLCGGATSHEKGSGVLVSVEAIDEYLEFHDSWSHKTDMLIPRHDAGVAVAGPRIYIIGGFSSTTQQVLQSIECFDTRQDVWLTGLRELPLPSRHICCVSVVSEWRKMNPNEV